MKLERWVLLHRREGKARAKARRDAGAQVLKMQYLRPDTVLDRAVVKGDLP